MSEENVGVVVDFLEAQGDPERFYGLLDPHVVFINRRSAIESRPFVGHDGVRDTLLNGKIVRCQGFDTRADALEAAGAPG